MNASRMERRSLVPGLLLAIACGIAPAATLAQGDTDLAAKTQNPVADLISVPLQLTATMNQGPDEHPGYLLNVQPVIPAGISPHFNLIYRPIVPIVSQPGMFDGAGRDTGVGDVFLQLYFTPKRPKGVVWGIGPALTFPTASDEMLGAEKWSLGPCVVIMKQRSGWTWGTLVVHQLSVAGDSKRADVNTTMLQPFLSRTNKKAVTVGASGESSYSWVADDDPLVSTAFFNVSKLTKWGNRPVTIGGSAGYVFKGPDAAGDFKARFVLSFLFPK